MANPKRNRVLITGGGTFIGINIASAFLASGAEVTLLLREGQEARLGALANRVQWQVADIWDPASLRGRARSHGIVVHTVGSMTEDAKRGLTYNRLNVVSTRNATNMCISDGVPHIVFISAAQAPWVNRNYLQSKRTAEDYVKRIGIRADIIRAPLAYVRGESRPLFYYLTNIIGRFPPFWYLGMRQALPMPLDVMARGIARIAGEDAPPKTVRTFKATDLRQRNSRTELRGRVVISEKVTDSIRENHDSNLDEDTPFGWIPNDRQ